MSERDQKPELGGEKRKFRLPKSPRIKEPILSGLVSGYAALTTYLISNQFSSSETAERAAIGVGGSMFFLYNGLRFDQLSQEEAQNYLEKGQKGKSKLKVVQSAIEAGAGFGAATALPLYETKGPTAAIIGGTISAAFFAGSSYLQYRERIRPLPELETPEGNSTIRDTNFVEKHEGHVYPPVYRTASIKDLKEFREVNQERLTHRLAMVPQKSDIHPFNTSYSKFNTAVFIVEKARHYPALDPEIDVKLKGVIKDPSRDVNLLGEEDNLVAHPCNSIRQFWPYRTIFDSFPSGLVDESIWNEWRERSWLQPVVILAQYQNTSGLREPKPSTIIDNYWLLDILETDGQRKRVKEEEKKPITQLNPVTEPQQI